jgi:hypothetical protein
MALGDFRLKRPGLLFFNLGGIMKTAIIEWVGVILLGIVLGTMMGLGF